MKCSLGVIIHILQIHQFIIITILGRYIVKCIHGDPSELELTGVPGTLLRASEVGARMLTKRVDSTLCATADTSHNNGEGVTLDPRRMISDVEFCSALLIRAWAWGRSDLHLKKRITNSGAVRLGHPCPL
jgi:hypothetical protein